ncbi:hypothetical protein DL769_005774 [Monosporascus sp. CRB-8-3]|nr:hypothetical protein DL769_005774 [Monosporascus sp. CRB-8-3]
MLWLAYTSTIPFNPKLDTVVIQAERLSLSGDVQPDNGFGYHRNVALQNWWDPKHWFRNDDVYSVNELPGSVGPWSKPMKVSAKFLERLSSMKLVADDCTIYRTEGWTEVWTFLGQTFTNLKCSKMDICELDSYDRKKVWHKKEYYKAHDLWVFGGLLKASREDPSIEREYSPTDLLAKLSTIEIEKVASHRTVVWGEQWHEVAARWSSRWLSETGSGRKPKVLLPQNSSSTW